MNTEPRHTTAKIYMFPFKARAIARNGAMNEMERFSSYVDVGNRYHQDAIDEARKADEEAKHS